MSTQILLKGSLSKEKRHDGTQLPIDYLGVANFGTLDSAPFWTITKLTIGNDGETITVQTALGAWTDRYILPYV